MTERRFAVFFGFSAFGVACLRRLLQLGATPCAVVTRSYRARTIPDRWRRPSLPVADALMHDRVRLAAALDAPVHALPFAHIDAADVDAIRALKADRLVSVCFPQRIPESTLARFAGGGINVHSSLLPAYRGPVPVFWQIRDDNSWLGVSVHQMTDVVDAGAVITQQRFAFADDRSEPQINRYLGAQGARLLADVLLQHGGRVTPAATPNRHWCREPRGTDFLLMPGWPARRAQRFLAATSWRRQAYYYGSWREPLLISALHGVRASPRSPAATKLLGAAHPKRVCLAFADAWVDVDAVRDYRASNP